MPGARQKPWSASPQAFRPALRFPRQAADQAKSTGRAGGYQQHKLRSDEIKETTWERLYKPRMALDLKTATGLPAARDATQLLEAQADLWSQRPGCRTTCGTADRAEMQVGPPETSNWPFRRTHMGAPPAC